MWQIRVGAGQSASGKKLDKATHWYVYDNKKDEREIAIKYAIETHKDIYISYNHDKYTKTTIEKLRAL